MQQYGVNFWVLSQREYHEDVAWYGIAWYIHLDTPVTYAAVVGISRTGAG